MRKIFLAAETATMLKPSAVKRLKKLFADEDSAVRYWAAMGMLMRGADAVTDAKSELRKALEDSSPHVRVIAAQALAQYGNEADANVALPVIMAETNAEEKGIYLSMLSLNAIDELDDKAAGLVDQIQALPDSDPKADRRMGAYVRNLKNKILSDLGVVVPAKGKRK